MVEVTKEDREAAANVWRDYVAKIGEVMAEKAIRNGGNDDTNIVQAFATHRHTSTAASEARIAELEGALAFIADAPDPGADKERSAMFYRVHAAMLKQIAAKALGRQIVSAEAMEWATEWLNSPEGQALTKGPTDAK